MALQPPSKGGVRSDTPSACTDAPTVGAKAPAISWHGDAESPLPRFGTRALRPWTALVPAVMQAMVLEEGARRLAACSVARPIPARGEILVRVLACGVCRTDLHIVDGELHSPRWPLIPGHEVVGEVTDVGVDVAGFRADERVGLAWLAGACGRCFYCRRGEENLCRNAEYTGFTRAGGYAEYVTARADFAYHLPPGADPVATAPLLCAGLIGYRTWRKAGDASRVGLFGFGAAAHILAQLLVHEGREVFAFTRPGDHVNQEFARKLGAAWAGGSDQAPPAPLDAALIFAPVGSLVPTALAAVRPGGIVVCGGIHMSDIPSFPYHLLWKERRIASVANLTRADGQEFLKKIASVPVKTETRRYPLIDANAALDDLRSGRVRGAAVLVASGS